MEMKSLLAPNVVKKPLSALCLVQLFVLRLLPVPVKLSASPALVAVTDALVETVQAVKYYEKNYYCNSWK